MLCNDSEYITLLCSHVPKYESAMNIYATVKFINLHSNSLIALF